MKPVNKSFALALASILLVFAIPAGAQEVQSSGVELSTSEVRRYFKDLRSRHQIVRDNAVDALVESNNDLAQYIKKEIRSKSPVRLKGVLKVAQMRPEYADLVPLADFLGSKDSSLASEAARTLRAWGVEAITSVDVLMRDDQELAERVRPVFEYEARYAVSSAIIAVASAPGYFDGQYDSLLSQGEWAVTSLADLAELNEGVAEPMTEAVVDLAEKASDIQEISYGFARLLRSGKGIPAVVRSLRGEKKPSANAKVLQYAHDIVLRMRKRAVQALGEASAKEAALSALKRTYRIVFSPDEDLSSIYGSDTSLSEEVEISLSRLGEAAFLNTRLASLRLTASTPAAEQDLNDIGALTPVSKVNVFDDDEIDPDVRKKIAYLLLRAGRYSDAAKEYTLLLTQLEKEPSEFSGDSGVAAYNLACAQARSGKLKEAFKSLKKAAAYGYDSYNHYRWMLLDGDLKDLREMPEFVDWFTDKAPPYLSRLLEESRAETEKAETE